MAETIGFNPEAERSNKVEMIKVELVKANFLKPDEKQKDQMSENLGRIFSDQLRHGTKSVAEMDATIKGVEINSHTESQAKMAEEDKKILGEAVVLATRELTAEDSVLASELFLGSKHVDNLLPKELKGLGREITKPLINSEEIDKQLNLLEVTRQKTDLENPDSVKTLSQKIEMGIDKLIHKEFDTEEEIEQQDAVLTILNEERRKLSGKNSFSNRVVEDVDFEPLTVDPATQEVRGGARWEISPENAAMAMKFMDSGMRWQSYTPPEWFKKIKPVYEKDGKTIKETAEQIQARIEYMVMVNDGAASMSYAGKDLDKIQGNKMWFAFDNEKFTKLFNEDFKLVNSKMLNDLCELYEDKNGRMSLRYKEGINKKGKEGIKANVEDKLENIRDYKDELALFLAKENGREKANYMDQMNAYTAWNLFYMFGDSSIADRMRVLPTYGGIISDGMRTLNPEYKARGKWKIGKPESDLFEAEYFGGSLADYALTVMRLEKDSGRPINGRKTLREKIADGEMKIFDNKMCYGFYDFTHGTRDLRKPNGEKFTKNENVTLATLLMDYAKFNDKGDLVSKNEKGDFSFGHNQVDFMNWYRDQVETAALSYNCMMGKADVKSPESWAHNVKDKIGMVRGISINGQEGGTYKYTQKPDYWADMILGSFGADTSRLSSDYIYVKTPKEVEKGGYNLYLYKLLVQDLNISRNDVDINAVMRYMGVNVRGNSDPRGFGLTMSTDMQRAEDKRRTEMFYRRK